MTHTTEVSAKPASGPGALAGHEFVCSCGERQGTSLSAVEAEKLAAAHREFHAERDAALAKIDANHAAAVARADATYPDAPLVHVTFLMARDGWRSHPASERVDGRWA